MATFTSWLAQLAAAQKGPVTFNASRGRLFEETIAVEGNWTGATMRGEIRLEPDATGSPLASFSCSAPNVVGGFTHFTVALSAGVGANTTGGLPADPSGKDNVELCFDLLITPSGGAAKLLFGGIFNLIGRVTA